MIFSLWMVFPAIEKVKMRMQTWFQMKSILNKGFWHPPLLGVHWVPAHPEVLSFFPLECFMVRSSALLFPFTCSRWEKQAQAVVMETTAPSWGWGAEERASDTGIFQALQKQIPAGSITGVPEKWLHNPPFMLLYLSTEDKHSGPPFQLLHFTLF